MGFRKYRLKANLTQQELADKVGCSKAFISQLENHKKEVSVKLLIHISIILNVCLNDLLGIKCRKTTKSNSESI